jgi:hypothetical protein
MRSEMSWISDNGGLAPAAALLGQEGVHLLQVPTSDLQCICHGPRALTADS